MSKNDTVVLHGGAGSRRFAAAALNLLICPGVGSLTLGRRRDAVLQFLLVAAGMIIIGAAGASLYSSIADIFDTPLPHPETNPAHMNEVLMHLAAHRLVMSPPEGLWGLSLISWLVIGAVLLLMSWIFSLVSVFLPIRVSRDSLRKQ